MANAEYQQIRDKMHAIDKQIPTIEDVLMEDDDAYDRVLLPLARNWRRRGAYFPSETELREGTDEEKALMEGAIAALIEERKAIYRLLRAAYGRTAKERRGGVRWTHWPGCRC